MRRRRRGAIRDGAGAAWLRGRLRLPSMPVVSGTWLFVAIGVAGLCLLYLWQSTLILDLTARRESAKERLTATLEVNRWLDFQIGEAFSLDRISEIARTRLHMVEPTSIRYVHVASPTREP
ncbi:MAG: hypothetical protein NT125_05050 [Candidatus Bipolaricaulota bacterium]|jgi:hypothetical protein|nr:hypothetical protein [Candidatus Bipolaricaulota bacterium]